MYCDHVVKLRDDGVGLDEANIRLRCGSCHTLKTVDARARRLGLR
ncbi:HNH endonuclease [Methylobacterium sp. R2-1]